MQAVTRVVGSAIPMDRSNVDTDQIIPAKYLKRIERTGYGPFAFEAWRKDPDFVLNNPAYDGASIMLAKHNFGSGSSREHAVWAIEGLGEPSTEIEIDLETQTVRAAEWERKFEIDPFSKYRLQRGLDDISMTLAYDADVAAFEAQRSPLFPTTAG